MEFHRKIRILGQVTERGGEAGLEGVSVAEADLRWPAAGSHSAFLGGLTARGPPSPPATLPRRLLDAEISCRTYVPRSQATRPCGELVSSEYDLTGI
jgi:hypothetical protein